METTNKTRTNRAASFSLEKSDVVTLLIQNRIALATNTKVNVMEAISVLNYSTGEQISAHYDFIHPDNLENQAQFNAHGQRKITSIVYLNDEYEDGYTAFPKLELSHKGRRGDAIFFINIDKDSQPELRTLHSGRPPESGQKWVITQFIGKKP